MFPERLKDPTPLHHDAGIAGLWAVVWILLTLSSRDRRVRFEVDRWGNVWARSVTSA